MARLPQGMRRTPSGRIELRFTFNGSRYSVTGSDVADVLEKERERLEELKNTSYVLNKDVRLCDYYKEYLRTWQRSVRTATVIDFKCACERHILPALGKYRVRDLEIRQVQVLYDNLIDDKGLKVITADGYIAALGKILKEAVADGIIKYNPCERIRHRKNTDVKATETFHRALSKQEQAAFEKAIVGSWYEHFLMFMLYSGCRFGETAALTWDCVDFVKGTIQIKRTMTRSENGGQIVGKTTKTESGERVIPMTGVLKKSLLEQRKRNFAIFGKVGSGDLVFLSKISQKAIEPKRIEQAIRTALREMPGTEKFTSHALRATFSTRFLESGGSMKTLQVLLGHASFAMTSDLYSHVLPDTKAAEMLQMEKHLKGGE